jgi:hypothetical protein
MASGTGLSDCYAGGGRPQLTLNRTIDRLPRTPKKRSVWPREVHFAGAMTTQVNGLYEFVTIQWLIKIFKICFRSFLMPHSFALSCRQTRF